VADVKVHPTDSQRKLRGDGEQIAPYSLIGVGVEARLDDCGQVVAPVFARVSAAELMIRGGERFQHRPDHQHVSRRDHGAR
jgi:hypothetical protein